MNDYNFDYLNYITGIPYINNFNPDYKMNDFNKQMFNNNQIIDPKEGFKRGNLFNNLYDKYKNYVPVEINPQNEQEALLNQWQQYNFAITDLNLYLDIHPNDIDALKLFNNYNNILNEIASKYEKKYGPVTVNSVNGNTNNWNWIESTWPWEGDK